jgi:dienelactone hydrolase
MRSLLHLAWLVPLVGLAAWGCDDGGSTTSAATGTSSGTSSASSSSSSSGTGGAEGSYCTGKTSFVYDPASKNVTAFPDDYFTVDDATSPTGLRVHMALGDNVAGPATGPTFKTVFNDISTLDGFGTTAAIELVFDGPLDEKSLPVSGEGSGKASASVVLVDLDATPPAFVDVEWTLVPEKTGEAQTTLILAPMVPLVPKARYGVAVTTAAKDAMGQCVAPSSPLKDALDGAAKDPALARIEKPLGDLVKALTGAGTIKSRYDLSAAFVFTTEHTVEDSAAIAQTIRKKKIKYTSLGACKDSGKGYSICEGTFPADDFRVNKRGVDDKTLAPQGSYVLPVTTYLPATGKGPFPTIIFGHGLNGDRHQAEDLAVLAAPQGYATIAIDAVKHGDHPDMHGALGAAPDFFGLTLNGTDPLDSVALRDHFRQSTYDKLQLLELIRPGVDIDGDMQPDVGIDKLVYLGVSLGGIMSAEFLAFAPEVQVAMPIVPGARVVDIIKDGATFAPVITILKGQATDGQVARFFPIVQTVVDRGDSGAYTQHIVTSRLKGFDQQRPQVLMQMVIADDTVPNSTNLFFARGLGVPHVGDELLKIGTIPHQQMLPVSANLDAKHTGGVFQYDVVYQGMGPMTQMATHGNVAANPVTITQTLHFLSTYYSAGVSEILDPYKVLGVKP